MALPQASAAADHRASFPFITIRLTSMVVIEAWRGDLRHALTVGEIRQVTSLLRNGGAAKPQHVPP